MLRASLLGVFVLLASVSAQDSGNAPAPSAPELGGIRLPLAFVENRGQWDARARFVARRGPMTAWFVADGWVFTLEEREAPARDDSGAPWGRGPFTADATAVQGVAVGMTFEGAAARAPVAAGSRLPGRFSFFLGGDPARWARRVPAYARLRYPSLYPGVAVVVREGEGLFEYDLRVMPGADLGEVVIRCEGIEGLSIEDDGSLLMRTALGAIRQKPPVTWHELPSGERRRVECRYVRLGDRRYGFAVPNRLSGLPLVIDPGLLWMTLLGGSGLDRIYGVGRDAKGMITVAGRTSSSNLPKRRGSYRGGRSDAFVSRLDPKATGNAQLVWSAYLGGAKDDLAFDMVVDRGGLVTVAGFTFSSDFPRKQGSYDTAYNGGMDAFVTRLFPDGSRLLYSTYLGSSGDERACGLEVDDASLTATVAGYTTSSGFPTTAGSYDTTYNGAQDAFVTRLDPAGSRLVYSTFLGGSGQEGHAATLWPNKPFDLRSMGLDQDASGRVAVVGLTRSGDFPLSSKPYQGNQPGWDAFVSVLDPRQSGSAQLAYSTYLGGRSSEAGNAAALQPSGVITVAGFTYSTDFPSTPNAFSPTHSGSRNDAFVTWLDPTRTNQLTYSTFLGGSGWETAMALEVDSRGVATLGGFTWAPDFPTTSGAYDRTHNGVIDAYVARLAPNRKDKKDLIYSTFIGGTKKETVVDLVLDGLGGAFVAGVTQSANFPTTKGAYQRVHAGASDGWVGHMDLLPQGATRVVAGSGPHCGGPILLEPSAWPKAGTKFAFLAGNAPKRALGLLALGLPRSCFRFHGANVCVNPVFPFRLQSNARGSAAWSLATLTAWKGSRFRAQTFWINNTRCPGSRPFSSSAALDIVLQ